MEKKKLTKKTILIITGTVFIIIALCIIGASMLLRRYSEQEPIKNIDRDSTHDSSSPSSESKNDITSEIPFDNASQAFAESSFAEESSMHESDYSESESSQIDNNSESDTVNHGWVINEFGYTYLYGNSGFEQFNYKTTALNRYSSCLNRFAESVGESIRLFNLSVPVSSTFASIPREIYISDNFYNQSQSAFVSTVGSKLVPKYKNINVVSELELKYDEGEYVYFRTDRNWTADGTYVAYKAFCREAGISSYPLESFVMKDAGEFLGSFYNATANETLEKEPDFLYYYQPITSVKCSLTVYDNDMVYTEYSLCDNAAIDGYPNAVYFGRDAERYEINTTADGGSLLVIGDSSVAPLVAFLASHYAKIDVINPEMFEEPIAEFLSSRNYDDILTMCYTTNAVNGNYIPSFNILNGVTENE